MADYSKKVKEILSKYGCFFERQGKGDHELWRSPITNKQLSVDSKMKSRHSANEVLKKAGIDFRF